MTYDFLRPLLYLISTLLPVSVFGQDTSWQDRVVSPDASIKMPGPVTTTDTMHIHWTVANYNGLSLQVRYFPKELEVHNGDELVQAYEGFNRGYLNSEKMRQYVNTVHDTSMSGTNGEWIHSVYVYGSDYYELFTYVVLANSHFYMLIIGSDHPIEPAASAPMARYYSSLHFLHGPVKEYSDKFNLQAKSYRFGERLGSNFPYFAALALGILILVVIFFRIRRRTRHRSR